MLCVHILAWDFAKLVLDTDKMSGGGAGATKVEVPPAAGLPPEVYQSDKLVAFFERRKMLNAAEVRQKTCERTLRKNLGNDFLKRFRVESMLGEPGGFGYCLKCEHTAAPKTFAAIKINPVLVSWNAAQAPQELAEENALEMEKLQREIVMMKRVHEDCEAYFGDPHPRFVYLDACFFNESATAICMQMPFEEGVALWAVINGDLAEEFGKQCLDRTGEAAFGVRRIASEVIEALLWLQSRSPQIIHRDLKPENILYLHNSKEPENSHIKLLDFGMVRSLDDYVLDPPSSSSSAAAASGSMSSGGRKHSKFTGTPGYIPPECYPNYQGGHVAEADRVKVDNFALGRIVGYLLFAGKATPRFPVSRHAETFIKSLLEENPAQRLSMTEAAAHSWILENGNTVSRLHQTYPASPPETRATNAPLRGVSLGAMQDFLQIIVGRPSGLKENLFGIDLRADEFEEGESSYKMHRQMREVAYLLYMQDQHEEARERLTDAIAWCENAQQQPHNFHVEQLYVQCLSQMVANYTKEKPAGAKEELDALLGKLLGLRGGLSLGNRTNVERAILTTRFKIIEFQLPREPTPEQARAACVDLNAIRLCFGSYARNALVGCPAGVNQDTELHKTMELSALLVDTRFFDLQLDLVEDADACEEICRQFENIYETRRALIGDHADARVLIQSAKNCGKGYLKLLRMLPRGQAARAARVKAKEDAVRFLARARNGQLKYLGPGEYLEKIRDKLEIAENFDVGKDAGPPAAKKARLSRE